MTHKTDSVISLPVTISGVESISDVESAISGDVLDTPGNLEGGPFDSGDGDLRLMLNGVTLEAHKYLIKRFAGLKNRIRDNVITLEPDEPKMDDFRNTFKILYASVIEGPFQFDQLVLTSALRVATTFDYPALRNFAIKHLEKAPLSAVERIRLAREFRLSSWEEPAYVELCNREEAMTKEEASVLGLDAFVHVAKIREKEQRRRGRDVDAAAESDDESQLGQESETKTSIPKGKKRKTKKSTLAVPKSDPSVDEHGPAKETLTDTGKKGEVNIPKPSFIDIETTGTFWRQEDMNTWMLSAPGCTCRHESGYQCALPPCIATAIKHLQSQQLAHNSDISKLETTMEHVQAALTLLTTPKPHAEPGSDQTIETGCVEKEVRKWLAAIEIHTVIT